MNRPARLHALDNLRAIMMWLGIVLHVSVNHLVTESPLPWHDPVRSTAADLIFIFIHAFRMPVFFVLAGFFVAMLVDGRGLRGMLRHRLRRIGLPFIVFWPPLFVATALLVLAYVHMMATGRPGLDSSLILAKPGQPLFNTMHLWFMVYLLWFSLLAALAVKLAARLPLRVNAAIREFWKLLASSWWGFALLAAPLAIVGAPYPGGLVAVSGSLVPNLAETVQSGLFFLLGWQLWRLFFFVCFLALANPQAHVAGKIPYFSYLLPFTYNCVSWLWSFALIGFFLRYLPAQNRFLRYLADSSYWVYLVHMLGTIGFGILLFNAPLNVAQKMGLNFMATTLACLLSYHLFVRFTGIGTLLNGQRHVHRTVTAVVATG
jgi:peptidoglycan/LPS O-acetylase OafA/YrhL